MLNYCCEPVDQIEGYIPEEKRTTKMVIHHRLESHDESGTLRTRFLSMQQLKDAGLLGRKCDKGIANFPKKLPNLHFIRITEDDVQLASIEFEHL